MLIDTHAHLDFPDYEPDREQVIQRASDAGIQYIITVGTDLASSKKSCELSQSYPQIYASIGIHPHEVKELGPDPSDIYDVLKGLVRQGKGKVIAWGEAGLDYYRDYSPREVQEREFRHQVRIAQELDLPLIIHARQAHDEVLKILNEEAGPRLRGVFHCFSGDERIAKEVLGLGFYISLAGPLTYPNSHKLQRLAKMLPTDRLLLETDAPFLTPQPRRGKRNEPAFVTYAADKLAEIKGLSSRDIARITSLNASLLFGIGGKDKTAKIVYQIRKSLYLNLTNRCTNNCCFCVRNDTTYVKGHNLKLSQEPSIEELWQATTAEDPGRYQEVVFCGLGEPTLRLEVIKEIARRLKTRGIRVRLNTNGQGNLIHARNILPELEGLIDAISVSLNAEDKEKYYHLCHPIFGLDTYDQVKEFIRGAKRYIPQVGVTVLDMPWEIDLSKCQEIAEKELGVSFRIREYNILG